MDPDLLIANTAILEASTPQSATGVGRSLRTPKTVDLYCNTLPDRMAS